MGEPSDIIALALDQSPTSTGWAIGKPCDTKPKYGLYPMDRWGDEEGQRLCQYEEWIIATIKEHRITHLFYESPVQVRPKIIYKNGKAILLNVKSFEVVEKQLEQLGAIHMAAHRAGVHIEQITPASWRMRFIGKTSVPGLSGDALRKELKFMAVKACALRGWYIESDDVADSLGLLDFGLSTLSQKHAGSRDTIFSRTQWQNDVARFRGEQ